MATTLHSVVREPGTWRRMARWALIGVELLIGAAATSGGIGLMSDSIGMPAEWLDGTPFGSWLLPGILLLAVVALPMIVAAVAELDRASWAYAASLVAGALQAGGSWPSWRSCSGTPSCSR